MNTFELLWPPTGATADQVMRKAKGPPLPGSVNLIGGDMPTEDLGQLGNVGALDAEVFADRARNAPQLPFPSSAMLDVPPSAPPVQDGMGVGTMPQGQDLPPAPQPSGGALPVPPASGTPAAQPAAAPPAAAPQVNQYKQFRQRSREISMAAAQKMMTGSPAMRVQGLQLLFSIQKDFQDEALEDQKKVDEVNERKRQDILIDASQADATDKERAKTLVGIGARPQDVAEALRFNNAGAEERTKRREQFTKWGSQVATAQRDLGTMEVNAARAVKLIDESYMTTGMGGALAQWIPGSAANQLKAALAPIEALIGYGYLQEMREQSKTGGAVGNVTENETRWLMGIQGGLDPVSNPPKVLKENIATVLEGKRIVAQMKQLAPALDAGDPNAWQQYAQLSLQLGENGQQIQNRMNVDPRAVQPEDAEIEGRY